MVAIYLIVGLLGLGIIVFVHELGHFIAAKAVGIDVEAFALGWGPPIISFRKGNTDYRLCAFPVGGYCKMKGEQLIEKRMDGLPVEDSDIERSLFGVSPLKRILTYFAGPFANVLFAVFFFSLVWIIGSEYYSYNSRIIVLADYPQVFSQNGGYPAVEAGLKSGDIVLSLNGTPVKNYRDIQDAISRNPDITMSITFSRNGETLSSVITPELNKHSGTGFIGVAPWIPTLVSSTQPGLPAHVAGIRSGDIITRVNGESVNNYADLLSGIQLSLKANRTPEIGITRDKKFLTLNLPVDKASLSLEDIGLSFESNRYVDEERNPFKALIHGVSDTVDVFVLSVRGISLLFKGIDLKETVSGPLRITYTVGQYAVFGFSQGFKHGVVTILKFISFISVALCFMNLLPLPAVDGGMILYNGIEIFRRKPLSMKFFYRFQMAGIVVIAVLLFTSLFNDIRYFFFK